MELGNVRELIRGFIVENFPLARNVRDDDNLLENRLIDSLGILQIVEFLEKEFQIGLTDEELLPENFESIATLGKFTESKLNGVPTHYVEL